MRSTNMKKILIIDDEPAILRLLCRIFSEYQIETANTGEIALNKIVSTHFNLILTDIKMPGISGDEVRDYARDILLIQTPIIGMSGTPWLLDETKFDAVLEKPILKDDLIRTVQKFI